MSEKIKYIDASQFEKEVLRGGNVIVDFYSTECPPCEALAAKFEPLSEIFGDDITFIKIFRQENRALAESLGVTSSPTVLFYQNDREIGTRLSGSIKRSELLDTIKLLLPQERYSQLLSAIQPVTTYTDILILGAGPAGLTAGIYTAQAKLNTIIVDTQLPGGQVQTTHMVSNYPGFAKPVEGFMLMHYMSEQAKEAGCQFRVAVDVTDINLRKKYIIVDGIETIHAKKIIVASGCSYRELNVPGEYEYKGKGISYCATCDAKYYQDKHVVVIGGGNSAIEESLFIAKFARHITIVHQFDRLQANREAQEKAFASEKISFMFSHEPRAFIKNDDGSMTVEVENLKTGNRSFIACDGVFIFAGMKPNMVNEDLQNNNGYIITDEFMHTSLPDVFAAGDIRYKPYRQITTAVSDGTIAAITAVRELEEATVAV
ncbi:MAG TPA: FAD-dependent oxidoreductase [Spirochaetota bacterium]|nr:FAD-dependent oxidoreductase [Spirochaetota bacterium]HOM10025.1 FAD-dependent oxidoreductase [Spirochaetota bacterium]HPP50266.1 FAD-dependent oxidoreductase [Spirochaetota bacterium]